jgi:hypothetical protein
MANDNLPDRSDRDVPEPDATPRRPPDEGRVSPLWAGISLLIVTCLTAAVMYAVLHDPHRPEPPATARAPAPGAVPLPDSPTTTPTPPGVPFPGDRATGTPIAPKVQTAPPPLKPAHPVQ